MILTLFANSIPSFQVFLERNPVTLQILCAYDLRSVARILAEYAKEKSATSIKKEDKIYEFIKKIFDGNAFVFTENIQCFDIFKVLFDGISIGLIQEHLYSLPCVNKMETVPASIATVVTNYEEQFKREQLNRSIKSPLLLKNPAILYQYLDKKSPVTPDEAEALLQIVEEVLRSLSGKTLECLLLTGGHGTRELLNNLTPKTRDDLIVLFHKYNVSVESIAVDCCFGAWHLDKLRAILSKNGVIVANCMESIEHSVLQAFHPEGGDSLASMCRSFIMNPGIVVYINNKGRILSFKPNEIGEEQTLYAKATKDDFDKYSKSKKLPLEPTSALKLIDSVKEIFSSSPRAPITTPLAKAKRQLLFSAEEKAPSTSDARIDAGAKFGV